MNLLATDFLIKEIFLCIELGTLAEGFVPSEEQKGSNGQLKPSESSAKD